MSMALKSDIENFVLKTATLIDRDDLEAWLECFQEDASYIVAPRENLDGGHQIGLMRCENRAQLKDRVAVLRHASKFNPHWDRHILSGSYVDDQSSSGVVKSSTSFLVVQTQLNGVSTLFCSGSYEDEIDISNGLMLRSRLVVLDSFAVKNCMAVPL